jgi:hypothetical protein
MGTAYAILKAALQAYADSSGSDTAKLSMGSTSGKVVILGATRDCGTAYGQPGIVEGLLTVLGERFGIIGEPPPAAGAKANTIGYSNALVKVAPLLTATKLGLVLSDKALYNAPGAATSLTCGLLTAADGGLDTGGELADKWYYLYGVPSTAVATELALRFSLNAPSVGPANAAAWKYLSTWRNDGSSLLVPMRQVGHDWFYTERKSAVSTTTNSLGTDVANLTDLVPATANAVHLAVELRTEISTLASVDNTSSISIYGPDTNLVAGTASPCCRLDGIARFHSPTQTDTARNYITCTLPLTSTREMYYAFSSLQPTYAQADIYVLGWHDPYG